MSYSAVISNVARSAVVVALKFLTLNQLREVHDILGGSSGRRMAEIDGQTLLKTARFLQTHFRKRKTHAIFFASSASGDEHENIGALVRCSSASQSPAKHSNQLRTGQELPNTEQVQTQLKSHFKTNFCHRSLAFKNYVIPLLKVVFGCLSAPKTHLRP